jgi:D-alanyl-D-alanine carboxypeptidase/D-alanyl-D-alanine-endopeptidase (penicillin-binding protein 4)
MKLLTSAVALKRLGADFKFTTLLAQSGKDLVVYADGDPTFGDPVLAQQNKTTIYAAFDQWAAVLKERNITQVEGDLVVRMGIFGVSGPHPNWPSDQLNRWYAAPICGANFNNNCVDVSFKVAGGAVTASVMPESRWLKVASTVKVGKSSAWSHRFDKTGTALTLWGTVDKSSGEPISAAAPNPGILFAVTLAERLALAGIAVKGNIVAEAEAPGAAGPTAQETVLARYESPLSAALGRANKNSLNMMAECMLLRSAAAKDAPATWETAVKIATAVLKKDYGLDERQFTVDDGCGLSKQDRVSPQCITTLLCAMSSCQVLVDSLAVGGKDGSLYKRLTDEDTAGRVLAKTGTVTGASCLSGYVTGKDGKPAVAFSVMVNGSPWGKKMSAHDLQDGVCRILVEYLDQKQSKK